MRGRGTRIKSRLLVTSGTGSTPLTLEKSIFSLGRTRFAIRKRAQVLPDFGNETRKVSSAKTARLRPGLCSPNTRLASTIARLNTEISYPRAMRAPLSLEKDNALARRLHKETI